MTPAYDILDISKPFPPIFFPTEFYCEDVTIVSATDNPIWDEELARVLWNGRGYSLV